MNKWEHLTFSIGYGKKQKDWILEFEGRPPLVGLQAILEAYGADGWELVSLQPDQYQVYPAFGQWSMEPARYRATLKRPVEHLA